MEGVFSLLVRWARCAGIRAFYPALAALVSTVGTDLFSSPHAISFYVSLSLSNFSGKAVLPGRLSLKGTVA
jgi:hypothetical protein